MPERFQLLKRIISYVSKPDATNSPVEVLIQGSQNVLISDQEKIQTRKGYTIYGAAGSGSAPIESSYDWNTSTNSVLNLRAYDDELEVYVGTVEAVVFNSWERVLDGWTAVDFSFAPWWSATELIDELLFVNGTDKIQEWSGGLTTFASATTNTITKQGTDTWDDKRFLVTGTTLLRIKDSGGTWREFTYTGGETTTTLTGVTPDPTGFTFNVGALIMQSVRENDNEPIDGAVNDFIKVHYNQVWVGSNSRSHVYVSKDTDFTLYTFSTPRVPGEGALLVLDSVGRAFAIQREKMLIAAGRNDWYINEFAQLEIGTTLTETLKVRKLKTGVGKAARHHDLVTEVGDYLAFVDFNNELMMLGDIENLEGPQLQTLSDPIKSDWDDEDFTNGHIKAHKNRIYIACPATSHLWINETRQELDGSFRRLWQPPQILPIRRLAVISDKIYGHSSGFNETYKLFDGTNDNGNSFKANATYSYRNYDVRDALKIFDEWYVEGYISANTELILRLNYDYGGSTQQLEKIIKGSDSAIIFQSLAGGRLGDEPLGDSPIGDQPLAGTSLPKFRVIKEFPAQDFYEVQIIFETDAVDAQWQILAQGSNARLSPNMSTFLKS